MIIFIWTCQMEFSSFSSFHHTPHSASSHYIWYTRSMSNATLFDVRIFFRGFRKQTSIFLPHSSFSRSRCLLTAFRYRQEANIEERENFSMKNRAIRWSVFSMLFECHLQNCSAIEIAKRANAIKGDERINFLDIIKLERILGEKRTRRWGLKVLIKSWWVLRGKLKICHYILQ